MLTVDRLAVGKLYCQHSYPDEVLLLVGVVPDDKYREMVIIEFLAEDRTFSIWAEKSSLLWIKEYSNK